MTTASHALVRGVPNTFDRAIRPPGSAAPIDLDLARRQHAAYCAELERLGLTLVRLEPDDRYPDCCYVEDTALVIGRRAIITRPGAEPRRGETAAVAEALSAFYPLRHIKAPATLDGGDVLRIENRIYVGLSQRTNSQGVRQLATLLEDDGYEIIPVETRDILHLKSASTYLGDDHVTWLAGHLAERPFAACVRIAVPETEAAAANCLSLNGVVMMPAAAPRTQASIERAGFQTIAIDISESVKAGGGLTCSCILFGAESR